jgi:hypothetical protein
MIDSSPDTPPSGEVIAATDTDNRLRQILNDLESESKDIQVSMVVTRDGLTMLALGNVNDADKTGALCSDLLRLCHAAALELARGEVEHVLMMASDGCLLLTPAGEQAMLAVMARRDANLGMLMIDTRRAAWLIPGAL